MYVQSRGCAIVNQLGGGYDGAVYGTDRGTAVKSLIHPILYRHERDVYLHLREQGITNVKGFQVPSLIDYDEELLVVEMTIVMPPYVLDFAGARLQRRHRYSEEDLAEWKRDKQEQFEADWPLVQTMIWAFESLGVYLNDVHPGNVSCR